MLNVIRLYVGILSVITRYAESCFSYMPLLIILNVVMLCIVTRYAKCQYAEFHYAECGQTEHNYSLC
jgi:hypothetical protein